MNGLMQLLVVIFAFAVFFLPSILALRNQHPQKIPIILVNVLGGWVFGIGWLIALIWVFVKPIEVQSVVVESDSSVADEVAKLGKLKTDGVLTEEEFQQQKEKLLKS